MLNVDYDEVEKQLSFWRDLADTARDLDEGCYVRATAVVVALNAMRDPQTIASLEAERLERARAQPSLLPEFQ